MLKGAISNLTKFQEAPLALGIDAYSVLGEEDYDPKSIEIIVTWHLENSKARMESMSMYEPSSRRQGAMEGLWKRCRKTETSGGLATGRGPYWNSG